MKLPKTNSATACKKNVGVVIVTFNGERWIEHCISSIYTSEPKPKIIVVDNCSQDQTIDRIQKSYPEIQIITRNNNYGFSSSCNIGMQYCLETEVEFVVSINQDTILEANTLTSLVDVATNHPEFGILFPDDLLDNGEATDPLFIQELSRYAPPDYFLDRDLHNLKKVYAVPALSGALIFFRRSFLEEVGGLDPLFFYYGVEHEICSRARHSRWKVGYAPGAVVYHTFDRSNKAGKSQTKRTLASYFYTTCFEARHRSFLSLLFNQIGYCSYLVLRTLMNSNYRTARTVSFLGLKTLGSLPRAWSNRKSNKTGRGMFLSDARNVCVNSSKES